MVFERATAQSWFRLLGAVLLAAAVAAVVLRAQGVPPAPLPAPPDEAVSLSIGPVTVSSFSPVTITAFEKSTLLYFTAKNTGTSTVTFRFTSIDELRAAKPSWMLHLFKFFDSFYHTVSSFTLSPGQMQTLTFYVSVDRPPRVDAPIEPVDLPFRFEVAETGDRGTLVIRVQPTSKAQQFFFNSVESGVITGRVTAPDGSPIPGAAVTVGHLSENDGVFRWKATTDADGRFRSTVFSIDEVKTAVGTRPLPYRSLGYFLNVEASGYAMAYRETLEPPTGEPLTVDVTLQRLTQTASYQLVGERATDGLLSYWWIRFAGNGDRVVSVQAQHPPAIGKLGHILAVDLTGRELWRVTTGDECWGLDVSADGSLVAAGCHDGFVYVVSSSDGRLLYKVKTGDRDLLSGYPGDTRSFPVVIDVRFSPDGKSLLADGAGGPGGFTLLDVGTGTVIWKVVAGGGETPRAYKTRWSRDGARVVTADEIITVQDAAGRRLWANTIGVVPLFLEMDDAYNVYAVGKSRTLVSWDKDGRERWRYFVGTTANSAWKGITSDGTLVLVPGFDGYLHAVDSEGRVLWRRFTHIRAPNCVAGTGHNGLSMTPSADLIVVAGRCYDLFVYDRGGTLLWSHKASPRSDFQGDNPINHGGYDGTISTAVSPDGTYIAAGYADSVIRIFKRQPTLTLNRTSARFGAITSGGTVSAKTPAQTFTLTQAAGSGAARLDGDRQSTLADGDARVRQRRRDLHGQHQ
jgi:hypothetical protein